MTPVIVGIAGFLLMFLLMALNMPIAFAMGLAGFLGIWILEGANAALSTVGMKPFTWAADYNFMCIPLFVLMGHFANESGLITLAFRAAYKWVGRLPGGLAVATLLGSGAFGAVSGSSSAAAATMSTICIPEMEKYNYNPNIMTGSVAVGGTFAIMIPPSLGFIIYGIITTESIGKLFIAGIFPGLLLILTCSLLTVILCKMNPTWGPPGPGSTFKEKLVSLARAWELVFIFLAVIGGMYWGVFTATEAAAIGTFIAFIFALAKGTLSFKKLFQAVQGTARVTVMIFTLIIGAMIFNTFIAFSGIPDHLKTMVLEFSANPYIILILILLTYFIAGCIMDTVAMAVLLLPIYYPIITSLGFNGIWFGVIVMVMAEIGLITPPIGLNCYVIAGAFPKYRLGTVFIGALPYVIAELVALAVLILFPQISLFLPNLMK
ncbi:MAG: TRAP transporter large permease [Deltaproteobacteria bacterium]|nr:TRAP transporter large permease [Deltaproteobacteria bacterium]